jgi:hypothetical protein
MVVPNGQIWRRTGRDPVWRTVVVLRLRRMYLLTSSIGLPTMCRTKLFLSLSACCFTSCAPIADEDCRELGVPYLPPAGVTDPHTLSPLEYCCSEFAQSIVVLEDLADGNCVPSDPLLFMCLREAGDRVCDAEENFCTSPLDCPPPDESFPLCCGEGDRCQGIGEWATPTGVARCCDGLEMIELGVFSEQVDDCVFVPFPDGAICVVACGDGLCTTGENACNCPADCS